MNTTHLPPLPPAGITGPEVCEVVRLYLAVWDDLTAEQRQAVSVHLDACANCTAMQRFMNLSTALVARLGASSPSRRVDSAIMAAIAAHNNGQRARPRHRLVAHLRSYRGTPLRQAGLIAAVAVVLLTVLTTLHFVRVPAPSQSAFILPATLTWSSYVLYHTETRLNNKGQRYHINTYHDLKTNRIHVETVEDGILDIVVVGDTHAMLGKDMMHHVAQWGATAWSVDESMFDLSRLRSDLQTKRAVYLGKDHFQSQDVYRIRCDNGLVLLLDMHFMPVNTLRGAAGPGTGEPMYDTLRLLSHSEVSDSMWDMSVPAGFQMGTLPAAP
jgi:hypothetical protein